MSALDDLFEQTEDQPTPGGCERCNAYQVLTADPANAGIYHLTITHDDWCPFLRSREGKNN